MVSWIHLRLAGVVDRAEFVKGFKEELDTAYDFLVLMFEDDAGAGADAVAKLHCEIREDHLNFSKALGENIAAAAAVFSQQVVADFADKAMWKLSSYACNLGFNCIDKWNEREG